jgi:bacterioferritin (cytochrome b1)
MNPTKKEYNNLYYKENKENIGKKLKEIVECDRCGTQSTHQHLKRHQKSKSCLKGSIKVKKELEFALIEQEELGKELKSILSKLTKGDLNLEKELQDSLNELEIALNELIVR